MMIVDLTYEEVFGFHGPSLCLLGNESDFKSLAQGILSLTDPMSANVLNLKTLPDFKFNDNRIDIHFVAKTKSKCLGKITKEGAVIELDPRYWERLFLYFTMMSWDQQTHYLNSYESCLNDLDLDQEINFICSSEF